MTEKTNKTDNRLEVRERLRKFFETHGKEMAKHFGANDMRLVIDAEVVQMREKAKKRASRDTNSRPQT